MVLRRLLRLPWKVRRSNHSILKEINPEYSLEGLMLKLKLQYFQTPDAKNWLIGKDLGPGKDWEQGEKRVTEDEMVRWHRLNGQNLSKLEDSERQGSLECCNPWGHKELDMTYWLNNNYNHQYFSDFSKKVLRVKYFLTNF